MGTVRTCGAVAVVMATWTGAWSRVPVAPGSRKVMVTWTVADCGFPLEEPDDDPPDDEPDEEPPDDPDDPDDPVVATLLTLATVPWVVRWLGRVIVTSSPALTSPCKAASRFTVTSRLVEVACSTTAPGCARVPRLGVTAVTRIGPGTNTTCPRASVPVWLTPRFSWSSSTAAAVAGPK